MKRIVPFFFLFLLSVSHLPAQWEELPGITGYRESAQYAFLDNKLYLFGGYGAGVASGYNKDVMMLDFGKMPLAWTKMNDMPSARVGGYAHVRNGKIYILGGVELSSINPGDPHRFNKTMLEYDPATDTYTAKANASLYSMTTQYAAIGNRIFAISGRTTNIDTSTANMKTTATVQMYDIAENKWTILNDGPDSLENASAAEVGGKIILAGGFSKSQKKFSEKAYSGEFADGKLTWTPIADMPRAAGYAAGGSVGGKFYLAGGLTPNSQSVQSDIFEYDPAGNTWTNYGKMPFSDYSMPLMVSDGTSLYYISGNKKTTVYKFTPQLSGVENTIIEDENFSISPNPGSGPQKLGFRTSAHAQVEISLYSSLGEKIATLLDEEKAPGYYEIVSENAGLATGTYFYKLRIGRESIVRTVQIIGE